MTTDDVRGWGPRPAAPGPPPPGEVHVWRARVEADDGVLGRLERTLSPQERERAERFRFDTHRRAYVVGRGTLRAILARYLGEEPARLRLATGAHGKPFLADGSLRFNLSHSGDLALYAVATGVEVGVDIERITAGVNHEALAARFFSPRERDELLALPAATRRDAFFACWARKEAVVKAVGDGLSMGLSDFDVTVAPGEPPRLVEVRGRPDETRRWALRALDVGPGYAAALAVEGAVSTVRCWEWH